MNIRYQFTVTYRDTAPAEILCIYNYGEEIAFSLLYCLKVGKEHLQK